MTAAAKIAAAAGSYIWNEIEQHFFEGGDLPAHYDRVLAEMKAIFQTELIALELGKLKSKARNFRNWMNYYNNHGRKRADLREAVRVASELMEDSKISYLEYQGSK